MPPGCARTALGFLLGFALITKYALSKSPEAMAKGELLRLKLVSIQIPLGLIGIGVGLWCLIASFLFHV